MANQFLETQAMQASQNPSIISSLVNAPTTSSSASNSSPNAAGQQIVQNTQADPNYQQAGQLAQELSGNLYGGGFVSGGEKVNDSVLQELFNYDQMLEGKYASPFPSVQGYVDNPADAYSAGAGYASGVGGLSGSISSATSDTERAYTAAISGLLNKFLDFAQMREEKEYKRQEREDRAKQQKYDTELSIAKLMGGYVTLPDGKRVYIPSDAERAKSSKPRYTPQFGNAATMSQKPQQPTKTDRPPIEMFDTELNP